MKDLYYLQKNFFITSIILVIFSKINWKQNMKN